MQDSGINKINNMQGHPVKLLLVCPKFPVGYLSFHHLSSITRETTALMPPLGLLTIAGISPPDWEIRIIDEGVEVLSDQDIEWANIVGVTSMIVQCNAAVRVAHRARALGKPTIIGGPHVTSEPAVYNDEFDVLICNEGEITYRRFLEDYSTGSVVPLYVTEEKADLNKTEIPRFDLVRWPQRYLQFGIQFSRGCPYECEFCNVTGMLGHKMRTRTADAFLQGLDAILASGYRSPFGGVPAPIFVVDDNFIAPRQKTIELCKMLAQWNQKNGLPFFYHTQLSIDLAKKEDLLAHLQMAKFNAAFIGFETVSEESLEHTGKKQNLNVNTEEAVNKIQSYGIRVDGGFIVGFDTDKEDIFRRQAEFIEQIGVSSASLSMLTALPSSRMHKRLQQEGRLLYDRTLIDLSDDSDSKFNMWGIFNIVPKHFSVKSLMVGYSWLWSEVYSPKNYFKRVLKQVPRITPVKRNLRARLTRLKICLILFPSLSFKIILYFPFRFQYICAAIQVLFKFPNHIIPFCQLSMRGIHYLEFTRLEMVPWTKREIERLSKEEKKNASDKNNSFPMKKQGLV